MSLEIIIALAVAALIGLGLVAKLIPQRMPPQKSFKCSRCGAAALHNNRTAEAWRNGKAKFFCQACHLKWLQSRPPQERYSHSRHGSSRGGSGCLGVLLLFALLPLGAILYQAYA